MTQSVIARLILQHVSDTGETPEKEYDEEYTLTGFADITPGRRLKLAAAAADQALTFTDVIGILITSRDNPFDLKVGAGETALTNLRSFFVLAEDTDDGVHQTSVLLSGNGSNESNLEIWLIEKP